MKKVLALVLTIAMATLALVGCGFDPSVKSEGVMTHAEYMAAELDAEVTIEAFVQGKQAWWFNSDKNTGLGTFYLQDTVGGYFVYELPCTEEEYNSMTVGTRIKVTGYKAEWSGEVEIIDPTFEILDGNYVAPYVDVTTVLGDDALAGYQNTKVYFTGMTIVDSGDGAAYLYKWDGSGSEGDDLYFKASINGETYTFVIESYLTDKDSDVYKAVKALEVGDVVNMAGFLYWYEGPQPHITSISVVDAAD